MHGTHVPQPFPGGKVVWRRTGNGSVRAAAGPGGLHLTVARSAHGQWVPSIPGLDESGPACGTRLAAQRWAELLAAFVTGLDPDDFRRPDPPEVELAGGGGDADGSDLAALIDGGWSVRITAAPAGGCLVYLHGHRERLRALGGSPAEALRNAFDLADPEGGR